MVPGMHCQDNWRDWNGHCKPMVGATLDGFSIRSTGGIAMFEVLILLTVYGLLYIEIIEILEKCEHVRTHAPREIRSTY